MATPEKYLTSDNTLPLLLVIHYMLSGNISQVPIFLELISASVNYCSLLLQSAAGHGTPALWPSGSKRIGHC